MKPRNVSMVGRFELHTVPDGSQVYYDPDPAHAYYGEVKPSKASKGGYSYTQESKYIGASTPVKSLDTNTDPLLWWAAKLDQTGIAQLVEQSWPHVEWLRDPAEINHALKEAKLTWSDVRNQAAERGTAVHERIFLALAQDKRPPSLSTLSEDERGYGQAALKWWRDRQPQPLYAEQVTLCEEHRVAGRFDLLCVIDGEHVLVDVKTREKGQVRLSDHAQLSGYEMCNRSCGIGPSDRQLALILTPWGEYREFDNLSVVADFLASLEAYRRGGDLGKRVRAAEKTAA